MATANKKPAPPWAPAGAVTQDQTVVTDTTVDSGAQASIDTGADTGATQDQTQAPTPAAVAATVDQAASDATDFVTVTVPKPFNLRLDNDKLLSFRAGVQEMSREAAEHWYSKANGVEVYKPTVPAQA